MRKLAFDFDLIFLWPCIVFAVGVLLASINTYLQPSSEREYSRPSENRSHFEFAENDAQRKVNDARWYLRDAEWELAEVEWKYRRQEEKRQAKDIAWVSAITLIVLIAVMLTSDRWKLDAASLAWENLKYVSFLVFIIMIPVTWDCAKKRERLKLVACLLAMLMAAASTEHFIHQEINTKHVICPHCSDDDDSGPDN
jgi:uncharacterized membrane protein YidH (DUF202 family)